MKKVFFSAIAVAGIAFLSACGGGESHSTENDQADAGTDEAAGTEEVMEATYTIDAANSTVNWKGMMLGVKEHTGTLSVTGGSITVKGDAIVGGAVTVDMSSITTTDENYDEENPRENLVGHLSSADFFDVANHPTATFTIAGSEGSSVNGDLTVRGKTNAESVTEVNSSITEEGMSATGTMTFNRQNYDVAWAHPVKEMVISDDIELQLQLVAKK